MHLPSHPSHLSPSLSEGPPQDGAAAGRAAVRHAARDRGHLSLTRRLPGRFFVVL